MNAADNSTILRPDVCIIGGGPAGSTCASLLKKYQPDLDVLVLEKEIFPREHVGESQLPTIGPILNEMGVWDKVEAAGFPIKIGASYTWGSTLDRWDFDFVPVETFALEDRPAKFEGQRTRTAFQVDRAIYDHILLKHAQELGADVRQGTKVADIDREGDRITGLTLADGQSVEAKWYVDASGVVGLVRRAMGVASHAPEQLRNIAVWDYWQNADWAVEIGVGGTRVQVRSLPFGWIWFIPLGPTRTSIGLICPAEYYKQSGKKPEELYHEAVRRQPDIAKLLGNARPEGKLTSCRDWSHLADRLVGENWMLCGESAGFADPILAAGMSLAHGSARDAAYTLLELFRGTHDADWLRERYDERNRNSIAQHIRFAQYWYSANGCFSDIKAHCQAIAAEAGLKLEPQKAWAWLSQGGFTTDPVAFPTGSSFDVAATKQFLDFFNTPGNSKKKGKDRAAALDWLADGYNVFRLDLTNSREITVAQLIDGRIESVPCYVRGKSPSEKRLPLAGMYKTIVELLGQTSDAGTFVNTLHSAIARDVGPAAADGIVGKHLQVLEILIQEGWVVRAKDKSRPMLQLKAGSRQVRRSRDADKALKAAGKEDMVRTNL